jgi:predicted nucleotidyltransferase
MGIMAGKRVTPPLTNQFLNDFIQWASMQPDIKAVALVGSYARGAASQTSDIDLVILTGEPERYLRDTQWVRQFGSVVKQQIEDYGKVISLRVWYMAGPEVEYGLTTPEWAAFPLDPGTQRVIADGMQVLFERGTWLSPHLNGE